MGLVDIYQSQISSYDAEISKINGIISQIQAQGLTGTELAECLACDCTNLESNITHLQKLKTNVQAKLARLQGGWSGDNATYVNEIETNYPGVYTKRINRWLGEDQSDQYVPFFKMYGQASNDFQKERLLISTFGQ